MVLEDLIRAHRPCWGCAYYKECSAGDELKCLESGKVRFTLRALETTYEPSELKKKYDALCAEHARHNVSVREITDVVQRCLTMKTVEGFPTATLSTDFIPLVYGLQELMGQSMEDMMTGLPNRRYFDSRFVQEHARALRATTYLAVIMIDVDRFKSYNDTYGHPQGDIALAEVGKTLKNAVGRVNDIVARYGGEEFVVVLGDTDLNGATVVADRIRRSIELCIVPATEPDAMKVTVSVGVSSRIPARTEGADIILAEADMALYKAKLNGRNRVEVYDMGRRHTAMDKEE